MQISVELLTTDERIADLCNRYWKVKGKRFFHTADELAQEFGKTNNAQLSKLVQQNCKVTVTDCVCGDCRTPLTVPISTRSEFNQLVWSTVCASCRKARKQERDRYYEQQNEQYEQEPEERVDQFLLSRLRQYKRRETFAGEPVTTPPGRYAAVHLEIDGASQIYRFQNVTQQEFRFESEGGSADAPMQGSLRLRGTVEVGGAAHLNSNERFHYLVSVEQDGGFTVHRVYPQSAGRSSAVLMSEEYVSGGNSLEDDLEQELICAIAEDFANRKRAGDN